MLIAHKIIDCLRRKPGAPRLLHPNYVHQQDCEFIARLIEEAEKFDFGQLPLELLSDKIMEDFWQNSPYIDIPKLTEDELEAFRLNLLPLPSDPCWYEASLGGIRKAVLVFSDRQDKVWRCMPFYISNNYVVFTKEFGCVLPENMYSDKLKVSFGGPTKEAINWLKSMYGTITTDLKKIDSAINYWGSVISSGVSITYYLTLMINSKTTDKTIEIAPVKLNKSRGKRGLSKLYDHTIVTIIPDRYQIKNKNLGGTHKSPRLHWRRSHIRILHRGTDREFKTIIPRFLVGKEELGSVSHEYRVKLK